MYNQGNKGKEMKTNSNKSNILNSTAQLVKTAVTGNELTPKKHI